MRAKRILVVDDQPIVGQAIKLTLQTEGYLIDLVTSAAEALQKFEVGKYAVVLTDYRMGGMTGLELAERLKALDGAQPVILVSGSPPLPTAPVIDVLVLKPFSSAELRRAVATLCEHGCSAKPA